ncbi:hypothetical protein PDIDSM_3291 [Penicillium digitatum]|nr:hypothetical protein PDIDSM_3291 [Penicillium digitatum]
MKNPLHNPLPASLSSECKKAAAIIESFINPSLKIDGQIPRKIFAGAKMAAGPPRQPLAMGGVGAGGQLGAELTDFIFVLRTDSAVKTFMQSGNLTLGGNLSMAVGPIGRSAEAGGVVGITGVFAYSKTRGLHSGATIEGGVLAERADANKKLYGRKIRAKELLSGLIPPPPEARVLLEVLNGDFFRIEGAVEPASEDPEQLRQQNTDTAVQDPNEQSPGIVAVAANPLAVVEPSTEQTLRTAPTTELGIEEVTGDAVSSDNTTDDTHTSNLLKPISLLLSMFRPWSRAQNQYRKALNRQLETRTSLVSLMFRLTAKRPLPVWLNEEAKFCSNYVVLTFFKSR